jgi:hypothetical protein
VGGLEQDGAPVKIQELFLAAGEPSHIDNLHGVDAYSLERGTMSDRGDYGFPLSSKPMKPRSKRWSMLGVRSSPFSPF